MAIHFDFYYDQVEELSGLADIVLKLTQVFIAGHPSSSFVVPKLWDTSPNILISGMLS